MAVGGLAEVADSRLPQQPFLDFQLAGYEPRKYSSITETLRNSYHITAHQLICEQRTYLFQRHNLYLRRTFIIPLGDFHHMLAYFFL